jgi:hypothetical protein
MPGIPRAAYMGHPFQIVQSGAAILFAYQYASVNRVINMGKPVEPSVDTWMGTSNGHWEGQTLVIETTNFNPYHAWQDHPAFLSETGKVTERFTLQDDATIFYQFTVEDPATYSQPWKGELIFRRSPERLYEYACHEGNHAVPNILLGARELERAGLKQPVVKRGIGRLDRPAP